jgi:ATP-binding cassette subfamily B protein
MALTTDSATAAHAATPPVDVESARGPVIHPDRSRSWLRRCLPVVLPHKRAFLGAFTSTLVGIVLQMLIPTAVMAAIDGALVTRKHPLMPYILLILGLAVAQGVVGYASRYLLFRAAYDLEYDLRTMVFEHLTKLSASFYDRVQTGQLISRANSDIRAVQMFLAFAPNISVRFVGFAVAFVIMLTINVPLTFIAIGTLPLVYITGARMRALMFPISWVVQSRTAEVATIVDENVNGARVVKSFASEQRQLDQLAEAARRVQWASVKQINIRARYGPIIENLPSVGLGLVLLVGGYLVIHHELLLGRIVGFDLYVLMLQAPFQLFGMLTMLSQRAAASAGRIFEILDESPQVTERPDAVDLAEPRGEVVLDDVGFSYADGPRVLDELSLQLRAGETVALVGRTGSGKTTLSRLLTRAYDVNEGTVRLDGHDVRDLSLGSVRRTVGVVTDDSFLFSVSLRDNICYGRPDASYDEIVAAAKASGAHEFITAMPEGYDTVVGERGYTLSGGQRQRIAIARTLVTNPPVLILDDATSAIDVQVELEIHQALRTLMEGRTTLVIAHRPSTIGLADRVAYMEAGRIVAEGRHVDLLATEPRYAATLAAAQAEDDRSAAARAAAARAETADVSGA